MNIAHEIIGEKLEKIEKLFKPSRKSLSGDSTKMAEKREKAVKELLKSFFPKEFHFCKGIIQSRTKLPDSSLAKSNPLDCIIATPNHTEVTLDEDEIIIAENVFGVVEIKPIMDTISEKNGKENELSRAIKQTKSVKILDRSIGPSVFMSRGLYMSSNEDYRKIPVVIFSGKIVEMKKIIEYISLKLNERYIQANQIPDIIFSLNQGVLFHTTDFKFSIVKNLKADYEKVNNREMSNHVYIHFQFENNIDAIAYLIILMCNFMPPQVLNSVFPFKEYLSDPYPNPKYLIYEFPDGLMPNDDK